MNRDRITEMYEGAIGSPRAQLRARERIHWMCAQAGGERVLDIGCSQGIASILLAREGKTVTGVDTSADAIEYALQRLSEEPPEVRERVEFVVGDGRQLAFGQSSFDVVLLGEVIEHQVRWTPLVDEARRVVRPGGDVVITVPYGIFRYPDHKEPLYLADLLPPLLERFELRRIELLGRYVGLMAGRPARGRPRANAGVWERAFRVAEERLGELDRTLEERRAALKSARAQSRELEVAHLDRLRSLRRDADADAEVLARAAELGRLRASSGLEEASMRALRERLEALGELLEGRTRELDALVGERAGLTEQLEGLRIRAAADGEASALAAAREQGLREALAELQARSDERDERLRRAERERDELAARLAERQAVADRAPARRERRPGPQPPPPELPHGGPAELVAAGETAYRAGDHGRAAACFAKAAELEPSDPKLRFSLARAQRQQGLLDDALESLEQALALRPGWADALLVKATIGQRLQNDAVLKEALEKLEPLADQPARVLSQLAALAAASGDHARAEAIALLQLEAGSDDADALATLAIARWELGAEEEAHELVARLRARHDDAGARAALRFFEHVDDIEQADAMVAATEAPSRSLLLDFAELLYRRGTPLPALELFERALELDPADPRALRSRDAAAGQLRVHEDRWAQPIAATPGGKRTRGRVLHMVAQSLPHHTSGSTYRTHYLTCAQAAAGLDPHVVTQAGFPWTKKVADPLLCDLLDDVPYYRLLATARRERLDERLAENLERLVPLVEQLRPAVLHPASDYVNALLAIELGRKLDLPVVYEVRGFPEERLHRKQGSRAWRDRSVGRRALELRCLQEADHIVTIADVMKEHIVAGGIPADKVTVVPNAADPEAMRIPEPDAGLAAGLGIDPDDIVLGYVTTFNGYEGIAYLIEALALLRERGRPVKALLVGDGGEARRLQRQAEALDVAEHVVFAGRVPHDEVPAYYSLIDVFVVPRTAEATSQLVTPLKPFEAMAAGRAVVVSNTRALAEVVADGETGRIFDPENALDLANVVEELIDDPDERSRIAEAGRAWVSENRTWALNAERYRDLYERMGVA